MKAKLSTLTFVNPDYERNEFVKMGGTYDMSRSYCEIITLYADALVSTPHEPELFSN